jgi:hypothetical protein
MHSHFFKLLSKRFKRMIIKVGSTKKEVKKGGRGKWCVGREKRKEGKGKKRVLIKVVSPFKFALWEDLG